MSLIDDLEIMAEMAEDQRWDGDATILRAAAARLRELEAALEEISECGPLTGEDAIRYREVAAAALAGKENEDA